MKLNTTSTQTSNKGGLSAPAQSNHDMGKNKAAGGGLSASRLKQFQELKTQIVKMDAIPA